MEFSKTLSLVALVEEVRGGTGRIIQIQWFALSSLLNQGKRLEREKERDLKASIKRDTKRELKSHVTGKTSKVSYLERILRVTAQGEYGKKLLRVDCWPKTVKTCKGTSFRTSCK